MFTLTDYKSENRYSEQAKKERMAENIYLWKITVVLEAMDEIESNPRSTISIFIG